jgi:hypothetical protein
MMSEKPTLTVAQAVEQVLAGLDGPISIQELSARVLDIRPSNAKNPLASLRNHLRWEHIGKTLVYLDEQTILPMRRAMRDVRFRVPMSPQETSRRALFVQPAFRFFLRSGLDLPEVRLEDEAGHLLPVRPVTLHTKIDGPFGEQTIEHSAFDLRDWFRDHHIRPADSILVTIVDWEGGALRLEHEPAARRREDEIERQDRELADQVFAMLEAARDEMLLAHQAIPTAYARLSNPRGYPGSHWIDVLADDPRLKFDGWAIHYADFRSFVDLALFGEEESAPEVPFTADEGRHVYRFKAALKHRPGLWRTIEIQGKQTLGDFDRVLRDAFDHDWFDHMSGFWKLVRRGQSKRFREIDLGDIEPMGGGSGAGLRIAGLGLHPGDECKYVYDFGDWIEHHLTLEAIAEPEPRTKYPRIVAQNKPRYQGCESCREQGRKSRATYICLSCSNDEQREVLICDRCEGQYHEDHYTEKILY